MEKYTEQELTRRDSLEKIKELGINPYPAAEFKINTNSTEIKNNFSNKKHTFQSISLAGRIMSRRIMGKASFVEIKDAHGKIQAYINRDEICPKEDKTMYNDVFKKHLDIGDIIGVSGEVFITKVGEISIRVKELTVLSKAIKPLPIVKTGPDGEIYDEFKNTELKYRQRSIDLIVNENSWEVFEKRTTIINTIREELNKKGYMEVETPILQPIAGGASARPFVTHHNTLNIPLYLRIANELYLKRLIVGGKDGVYEFAKDFRNEGMDRTHNPEFTMLELYVAYKDYNWMMSFTEKIFEKLAMVICGKTNIKHQNTNIEFGAPYKRTPFFEAIKQETGDDISKLNEQELFDYCKTKKVSTEKSMGKGKLFDAVFGEFCEKKLTQPTFITDYPIEMSPLTKPHRNNPNLTERFELFINGKEIANAYSEQNNPIEQKESFKEQARLGKGGDNEAMLIDYDFLRAIEYGMPPTSGIGIGIDRLTMLLTNKTSIQDVLFFPQMKPKNKT